MRLKNAHIVEKKNFLVQLNLLYFLHLTSCYYPCYWVWWFDGCSPTVSVHGICFHIVSILFVHSFLGRPLGLTSGTSSYITFSNNPHSSRLFTFPNHLILPSLTTVTTGFSSHLLATSSLATRSLPMYRSILQSHAWFRSVIFFCYAPRFWPM